MGEENDFSLLEAIGGDCAGALTLGAPAPETAAKEILEEVTLARLKALYESEPSVSLALFEENEARLSLAGAQDKIAVRYESGKIYVPKRGAPTTHLLKLPNRHFKHLVENEHAVLGVARDLGLPVPDSRILAMKGFSALLIERYDREFRDGKWGRLHQEDFCQATGNGPARKHETEGGPSFAAAFALVEAVSSRLPKDLENLIRWLAFNVCIGNCDHHGKNLSFVLDAERKRWALSPFYDLLCTRIYPRLTGRQAMAIGGNFDGANLRRKNWADLANSIQYSEKALLRTVEGIAGGVEDGIGRLEQDGFPNVLRLTIRKQLKRVRRSLRV